MAEYRQSEYGPRDLNQTDPHVPNPLLWECLVTRLVDGTPNCHHKKRQPDGSYKEYDHIPKNEKLRALQDREREATLALRQIALAAKLGMTVGDLRDVVRSL